VLLADLAALGAALSWAIAGLISIGPARELGAIAFNRIRMGIVFLMLAAVATVFGGWESINPSDIGILALSGFIGIFIGDTALFSTLKRLGPRRNSILYASHAPISAALGYFFLQEILNLDALIGCALVLGGIILSIIFGKRRRQIHHWEDIQGSLAVGIMLGLLSGLGQAVGAILAKPAMVEGADPIAVSAIRVGVAALCLIATGFVPGNTFRPNVRITPKKLARIALSGIMGMGVGMGLLLYALGHESAGIVMTLSATTPVMILPLLWVTTRERPAMGAVVGAVFAVVGAGFIFMS